MTQPQVAIVTSSQMAVVRELLRDGGTDGQIAKRLCLSLHTVRSHMKHVLLAARKANRTQLVISLLRDELVLRPRGWDDL